MYAKVIKVPEDEPSLGKAIKQCLSGDTTLLDEGTFIVDEADLNVVNKYTKNVYPVDSYGHINRKGS